jgi:hypothetical protein
MKSVPNWIFYLHDFLWIFSQLLAIWFELFSFVSVFNSENRCRGVPPVSLSLCAGPARQQAVYAWRHTSAPCVKGVVPTAPRLPCPSHAAPDSPVARLASHAVDNRVRSRRRFASDRVCPSAPRHRRRHHLCLGKCAAPPCLHAEPAALTSLPPPRAPAAGCLTSPPSSCVGRRRAVRARAPLTPTVYPSLVRPPGRCPCAARICAVVPQSLRRSTPPLFRCHYHWRKRELLRERAGQACRQCRGLPSSVGPAGRCGFRPAGLASGPRRSCAQAGRWRFGPAAFELYFSIFRIYSNPCKFKNLCSIYLYSKNYKINFVG